MFKTKNKIITFLITLMFILGNFTTYVKAASVAPGGSFSATLSCGFYEGNVNVSANNASVTSISSQGFCERNGSVVATASAGSSGTASISITSIDVVNVNTMTEVAAGTYLAGATVSIVAPSSGGSSGGSGGGDTSSTPSSPQEQDNRSTNANLASLKVSEGKLNPAFDPAVTSYSVNLSAEITKLTIEAVAADAKASVSGAGEVAVKAGENIINISVKAENGSIRTYAIRVLVDEKPLVYTSYNDTKLGVVRNIAGVQPPATFEATTISLGGKDISAWTSKSMNKTILYLIDEKSGEKNFYLYDTKNKKITSIFKPTSILGKNVFLVDLTNKEQQLEGMKYQKITIDKQEMMGWEFDDKNFKNYSLIYVMNENGEMQYYQYEKTQNTLQLYSGSAPVTQKAYESLVNDLKSANTLKIVFISLTVIFALMSALGVYTTLKLRNKIKK